MRKWYLPGDEVGRDRGEREMGQMLTRLSSKNIRTASAASAVAWKVPMSTLTPHIYPATFI
jgi:hypothetical protein